MSDVLAALAHNTSLLAAKLTGNPEGLVTVKEKPLNFPIIRLQNPGHGKTLAVVEELECSFLYFARVMGKDGVSAWKSIVEESQRATTLYLEALQVEIDKVKKSWLVSTGDLNCIRKITEKLYRQEVFVEKIGLKTRTGLLVLPK